MSSTLYMAARSTVRSNLSRQVATGPAFGLERTSPSTYAAMRMRADFPLAALAPQDVEALKMVHLELAKMHGQGRRLTRETHDLFTRLQRKFKSH